MTVVLKALKAYGLLITIMLILAGTFGGYIAGYRLDQGGITRAGTLVLIGLPPHTNVYIDQVRLIKVTDERTIITLTPGTHSVIIETHNYQPWNEIFTITQGAETNLKPILVTEKPKGKVLEGADAAHGLALIEAGVIPTQSAPLSLSNGCAQAYLLGTHIVAELATTTPCATPPPYLCSSGTDLCAPAIVYSPNGTVRSIISFPGRDDALIVSAGNLVYVVELDPREPQFFATLFKGPTIGTSPYSEHSIVISNSTEVIELSL